ncbi:MAG: M23 family metallopeptidase [Candidatus Gracilibacteria bacterium]
MWSIGFLVLTSMNVSASAGGGMVGSEYLSLEISDTYVSNDEGYLIKNMPLEGDAIYDQNRAEIVEHAVAEGETLSMIAYRYGVKTSTIKYANTGIGSGDYLKVGQTLKIPPKDGIYVKVESGATIASLISKYKGDADKTKEFNGLVEDGDLSAGEEIFVVDGRPEVIYIASAPSYAGSSYSAPSVTQYNITPSAEGWIRPTVGGITQGYHSGHYAYDIADRSKPPILAGASGTIIEASSGTWGGGYGNHVQIDHGNGYVTLYAHMEVLYVSEGDYVEQGQVIGKMGNTGRVYGATGIHLHFELMYNGTKINPSLMGVW